MAESGKHHTTQPKTSAIICQGVQTITEHTTTRFTGGIKQGSPLSPLLYIVYMKRLLIELEKTKTGPKIGNLHIPALGYMDDLLLMATSTKEMEIQADCIKRVSLEWGFVINSGKTQIATASNQKRTLAAARKIWGIKTLNKTIKYLGVHIQPANNLGKAHWEERMKKALDSYHMLKGAGMKWAEMDYQINLQLYDHVIKPTMIYGSEITEPSETQLQKINDLQAKMMKEIIGAKRNTNNRWTLWETGKQTAQTMIEEGKLRLAMKIIRKPTNSLIGRIRRQLKQENSDLNIIKRAKEIAKEWKTTHWLDPETTTPKGSKRWRDQRDTAIIARETQRFRTWARPQGTPTKYFQIKPWFGVNDMITGLHSTREAKAILMTRANRIGVGDDPTLHKSSETNKCEQCGKTIKDTLEHALWTCENEDSIRERDTLHFHLEQIYEGETAWEEFEHKTPEEKTIQILAVRKHPSPEEEDKKIRAWEALFSFLQLIQKQRKFQDF